MSLIADVKKQMGYRPSDRCGNCFHLNASKQRHENGKQVRTAPMCGMSSFIVHPHFVCDRWAPRGKQHEDCL